jgi:hypothetical protein
LWNVTFKKIEIQVNRVASLFSLSKVQILWIRFYSNPVKKLAISALLMLKSPDPKENHLVHLPVGVVHSQEEEVVVLVEVDTLVVIQVAIRADMAVDMEVDTVLRLRVMHLLVSQVGVEEED